MNSRIVDLRIPLSQMLKTRPALVRFLEYPGTGFRTNGGNHVFESYFRESETFQKANASLFSRFEECDMEADKMGWERGSMSELARHIEATHHRYLREQERVLESLAGKVAAERPDRPELIELGKALKCFWSIVLPHLLKEERVLFPAVRMMESSKSFHGTVPGFVLNPIRAMRDEHERAERFFRKTRMLTSGYETPEGVGESYGLLMEKLKELEADTRTHMRKENDILFAKVLTANDDARNTAGVDKRALHLRHLS